MTKCEQMQNKIDELVTKAITETDLPMKCFYFNAAKGYEMKRDRMTVEELSQSVD